MSDSISDRINFLYNNYIQNISPPTDAQLILLDKLNNTSKSISVQNDQNPPNNTVCSHNKQIPTPKSKSHARKQISSLLGNQPITKSQKQLIITIPKSKLNEILKRDVVIETLRQFDVKKILNVLRFSDNFSPKIFNHPIVSTYYYEYGWQESKASPDNQLYYLAFYELLMIDLDNYGPMISNSESSNNLIDIECLDNKLKSLELTARIYITYNGYHIFITSHFIHHKSDYAWYLMSELNCDVYYMIFSHLNGFRVRLNPKLRADENIAAQYITTVGLGSELSDLCELLNFHDSLILKHSHQT
jgi:hypothetical protein